MPFVKFVKLPTTPAEKVCTPVTIEAAKSEPGRCGREIFPLPDGAPEVRGETLGR
jgi:hypothetical protein